MQFNEKLIYLMNITNTSNKMLARAINVDPSMVSLIRTGRRGQPRNESHIRSMAEYFASKCTSSFQRDALTELLGLSNIEGTAFPVTLADPIFEWLSGNNTTTGKNIEDLVQVLNDPLPKAIPPEQSDYAYGSPSSVFFGNRGKFEALGQAYSYLTAKKGSGTIFMITDENSLYSSEDLQVLHKIQNWKQVLLDQGFNFVQILPPASSPIFYDVVIHWIPFYLSGQVISYYYPRMRDNTYRRSMLICKNRISVTSDSVASEYDTPLSMISHDPMVIDAHLKMFTDLTRGCQRTMIAHIQSFDMLNTLTEYMKIEGDFIQCTQELPMVLFPSRFLPEIMHDDTPDFHDMFMNGLMHYGLPHRNLTGNTSCLNIAPVYHLEEVLGGKATYMFPGHTSIYKYTPEQYHEHLSNVISYMEEHPSYYFVPISPEYATENILVKKDRCALIIRRTDPVAIFEIPQPEIIAPFYEYLMHKLSRRNVYFSTNQSVLRYLKEVQNEFSTYLSKREHSDIYAERSSK